MKEAIDNFSSYESVKTHVMDLERRHEEDIAKLHDLHTKDYLLRRLDAYYNSDDTVDLPEVDVSAQPERIWESLDSRRVLEATRPADPPRPAHTV